MIIIVLLILAIAVTMFCSGKEFYSQAGITQLMAKGHMDTYLTDDAWKYIPPYGYGGYYF